MSDPPPSRRFRMLFGAAMLVIAIGYAWVWQKKTERVVVEAPPVLAVTTAVHTTGGDSASAARAADRLTTALRTVPGLDVLAAGDSALPVDGRVVHRLFLEVGAADTPGGHRIVLRRTDITADTVLHVYRVEGTTVDDAAYRMAVQVAMSFGLPRPAPPGDGN